LGLRNGEQSGFNVVIAYEDFEAASTQKDYDFCRNLGTRLPLLHPSGSSTCSTYQAARVRRRDAAQAGHDSHLQTGPGRLTDGVKSWIVVGCRTTTVPLAQSPLFACPRRKTERIGSSAVTSPASHARQKKQKWNLRQPRVAGRRQQDRLLPHPSRTEVSGVLCQASPGWCEDMSVPRGGINE